MALTYRREIDGLRAIAVSAVVLFHAGLPVAAGFVGVDVFFVISGYLITALLLREHASTGRIDLADFYARRVRRIFPAGIAVLLAVLVLVPILPVGARDGVLQSAAAAAVFCANIFFQVATAGYFTGDASQYPLLHLWSLSVEEQFYLVWPALMIVLLRARVPIRAALAVIAVGSLALAEWLMQGHPSAAFYQMPARAWELAAGALIAASAPRAMPRWAPWAGLALTVAACAIPLPHFPGVGALPAVAGAALVLAAIHGGATNALLASRPMVGVGLISYSLYLWHWPLLAIDRLLRVGPSPLEARLGLVALAVLLAFASYRYVETPLRKSWGSSRRTVAVGFATMTLLSCGAWAWREPPVPPKVFVASETLCHPYVAGKPVQMQRATCLGREPKVVIWGDSFAHAWTPMALLVAERLKVPAATLAHDGCPPLLNVPLTLRTTVEAQSCARWNRESAAYLASHGADTVIITARWRNFMPDGAKGLEQSIAAIAPHVRRILIIGPTPELTDDPDKCAALGDPCTVPLANYQADSAAAWAAIRAIDNPKVSVVNPAGWLCEGETCDGLRGGIALYDDTFHVSAYTAQQFGAQVAGVWN